MGIDRRDYSPGGQHKVVYAGVQSPSFRQAAESLRVLADLGVPARQVPRLTRRIGEERVAERDAAVAAFTALPRAEKYQHPPQVAAPPRAVVQVDGGRLQIRDAAADEETAPATVPEAGAAAVAGREFAQGWPIYVRWISRVGQGQVAQVIAELAQRQAEFGAPEPGEAETSPRQLVARALTYLQNHKDKMRYDVSRQQVLPLTSSHIEALLQEINQRVKGTEKFWCEAGAEPILQRRADYLSRDQPREGFWQRRQARETGQRRYRRAA